MAEVSWKVWVDPLVVVAMLAAAGTAAGWVWRRAMRPLLNMARDWQGSPPRPGVPARPGVMVRLEQHDDALAAIMAELSPNGGKSVRDRVEKIAWHVGAEQEENR